MSEFFQLSSTDGDFDLDSRITPIPGSILNFSLENGGVAQISVFARIQGEVHLALFIDGSQLFQWHSGIDFSYPFEIQFAAVAQLQAGPHSIGLGAKSEGAAGPRDWSPRWEKEGKPFGKIIRSPQWPLRLLVAKV